MSTLTDDVCVLCGCNKPGIFTESAQFVFWPEEIFGKTTCNWYKMWLDFIAWLDQRWETTSQCSRYQPRCPANRLHSVYYVSLSHSPFLSFCLLTLLLRLFLYVNDIFYSIFACVLITHDFFVIFFSSSSFSRNGKSIAAPGCSRMNCQWYLARMYFFYAKKKENFNWLTDYFLPWLVNENPIGSCTHNWLRSCWNEIIFNALNWNIYGWLRLW